MKLVSKFLPAAFAVLLLGFSAAPCRAQNEGPLLHAGLLGYTGGIEDEAMLLSPAAIGQVFGGPASGPSFSTTRPSTIFDLRFGSFSFKNDFMDTGTGNVPIFGLAVTKNISDFFSWRISWDIGSASTIFGTDVFIMPLKAGVLCGPTLDISGGSLRPYVGTGIEVSFLSEDGYDWINEVYVDTTGWGFGLDFLLGFDYLIGDAFSIGLEFCYSSNSLKLDSHGFDTGVSGDFGGLSILLNVGIGF